MQQQKLQGNLKAIFSIISSPLSKFAPRHFVTKFLKWSCINAFFSLEQLKAYKQAMIKHSKAKDDYNVSIVIFLVTETSPYPRSIACLSITAGSNDEES